MKRFPLRWLALWIFAASALPSQLHAQQSPPAVSAYPNNSEGLRELLENMLVVAKKGDKEQLQSVIRELEIPSYEIWFTKNFGQEKRARVGRDPMDDGSRQTTTSLKT
jgi:hypothetical protein